MEASAPTRPTRRPKLTAERLVRVEALQKTLAGAAVDADAIASEELNGWTAGSPPGARSPRVEPLEALAMQLRDAVFSLEALYVSVRDPYVGEGADGARRSAQIDRDELDTLAADDPRRPLIESSIERWETQARDLPRLRVVVRPGTVPDYHDRQMDVFVEIEFDGLRLSISGVEGPTRNGNCRGGAGQITLTPDAFTLADGWTREQLERLAEVWSRWHLNDMRAGCEHQRALGWTYDEHPSEPCPTCGYRMGSAWLFEEVPADVVAFLAELPPADKTYPWGGMSSHLVNEGAQWAVLVFLFCAVLRLHEWRRRPCPECPWRKGTPRGQFPPERYEALRATTGQPGAEAPLGSPMFACHKSPAGLEFVCSGWLAAVGIENITARLAAIHGVIDPIGFLPGDDWPELHASYAELEEFHGR